MVNILSPAIPAIRWTFVSPLPSRIHKTWWRHQMETFSALLAFCVGKSPVTGEFPTQRPVIRSFGVLFWTNNNCWASNGEAGDLRCHGAHDDATVMKPLVPGSCSLSGACTASHATLGITHWGRVTHICVSKLTIIGSDNGLSPDRRQTIIWTNAGILFIGPLGTKFSKILIEIKIFSFRKMHLKMSFGKWRPSCLGLNHCPGALLVSILTSNKTWRTRNAVRSSNGDCEKTTQHFAMMSASDLFVGYMLSSMAS